MELSTATGGEFSQIFYDEEEEKSMSKDMNLDRESSFFMMEVEQAKPVEFLIEDSDKKSFSSFLNELYGEEEPKKRKKGTALPISIS